MLESRLYINQQWSAKVLHAKTKRLLAKVIEGVAMKDFLTFKRMLTPVIIYTLFWVGSLICFVVGIYDLFKGVYGIGLIIFFFGPVAIRVMCEFIILFFRMNETITEINNNIEK